MVGNLVQSHALNTLIVVKFCHEGLCTVLQVGNNWLTSQKAGVLARRDGSAGEQNLQWEAGSPEATDIQDAVIKVQRCRLSNVYGVTGRDKAVSGEVSRALRGEGTNPNPERRGSGGRSIASGGCFTAPWVRCYHEI